MQSCAREDYRHGLAEGRRIVEAELAAERYALTMLANALADAFSGATLRLCPRDAALLDLNAVEAAIRIDSHMLPGHVSVEEGAA